MNQRSANLLSYKLNPTLKKQ